MGIAGVDIKRFKCIENLTIGLGNVTVLIGGNNSGKSSVLQALHFATHLYNRVEFVTRAGRLSGSIREADLVGCPVATIESISFRQTLGRRQANRPQNQLLLKLTDTEGNEAALELTEGHNRNIQVASNDGPLVTQMRDRERTYAIFVPGLAGITPSEPMQSSGVVRTTVARGDANLVLRNVLRMLHQDRAHWRLFEDSLRELFPELTIRIVFDEGRDETIRVEVEDARVVTPLEASGTGVLQAVQILSYITYFSPALLLLDEPDAHLHPNNQRTLSEMLVMAARERGVQVVLATHSRHLLDALGDRAKVIWLRNGQEAADENTDTLSILLDIGALDAGERLAAGVLDCVVLSEDADTKPLEQLLASSGFRMDRCEVWAYSGCTNAHTAKVLCSFIHRHQPNVNLVVHRDRDFLTDDQVTEYCEQVNRFQAVPFVTDGVDAQSHFLDAHHLSHLNQQLTEPDCAMIVEAATHATRDQSIERFTNSRETELRRERQNYTAYNVTQECTASYDGDPERYRHGKTVLGAVKRMIQERLHQNAEVFAPSPYLQTPTLMQIAQRLWPADGQ